VKTRESALDASKRTTVTRGAVEAVRFFFKPSFIGINGFKI
jgi:hypothetical protein